MAVHMGQIIKRTLYNKGMTVTSFSKKINRSRNVVYNIFDRKEIDTFLLRSICVVLETDFFALLSQDLRSPKSSYDVENNFSLKKIAEKTEIDSQIFKKYYLLEESKKMQETQIEMLNKKIEELSREIDYLKKNKKSKASKNTSTYSKTKRTAK